MAETSYPYTGGQGITDATYERLMAKVTGNGRIHLDIAGNSLTTHALYADSTGRQVKIRANMFYLVRGFTWESGAAGIVQQIDANTSGNPRIDLIVLRLDRSNFTVRMRVKKGVPAAVPAVPSTTQDTTTTGVYEVPLGWVRVNNNATTLASSDVTNFVEFVAEPPAIGHSGSRPPVRPGSFWTEYNTGRTFVGLQSKWHLIGEDGAETKLAPANNQWDPARFWCYATRRNGFVYFQALVYRKDNLAASPAGTDIAVVNLPEQFRFRGNIYADGSMSGNAHIRWFLNGPTGALSVIDHPNFLENQYIHIGPVCWPANY